MTGDGRSAQSDSPSTFGGGRPSFVDTHCHLGWQSFDADRDAVVGRALEAGVRRMVTIGVDAASSRRAVELAGAYDCVYAAVGVHPNDSAGFDEDALAEIRALARQPKVVAIGEIGLDYYRDRVAPGEQARAFAAQLDLAAEMGKSVIVHSRQATGDVLSMLEAWVGRHATGSVTGVLHSFSGDLESAWRAFDLGLSIGFSGPITFAKSQALRDLAAAAPADRFVVETDAPFLTPEPRRGRRNEPAYVTLVADHIARARGDSADDLAGQTTANAARLFGWTKLNGTTSS